MIEDSLYEVKLVWISERTFYVRASTPGNAIDKAADDWMRDLAEQEGIKNAVIQAAGVKRLCAFSSILQ